MQLFYKMIFKIFLILTILAGCATTEKIEIKETDPDKLKIQGLVFFYEGKYDRAIAYYNKAIEIDPRQAMTFFCRGEAYYYKGRYGKACSDWRRACELGNCTWYRVRKWEGICK